MAKIKIIILVLVATLFSFNQTAEVKLDTNDIERFNIVEFNNPNEEVNAVTDEEEIPIVEEMVEINEENATKKESVSSNNKTTSKKTTTSNKTTIEKKEEVKQENNGKEKSNSELANKAKTEKKEAKVDPPKQEDPKQDDKPKEEEKPKKVTCDDFYESIHKGRTDVKTKSACISYGEKIVFSELDEVIEYNKVHDNIKDVNIKSFTCYEVLDDNCNTKGWYLHFKCNTSNCDDSKIKKMYG